MGKKYKKYSAPPTLCGYNFSHGQARAARDKGRLLSMRLETNYACNLNCIYCNRTEGGRPKREIAFNKIKTIISEAKKLGARSIVVIGGGEPTIYRHFRPLIRFINHKNMIPVVITNGTKLAVDMCLFLYKENASVLFKLDSLNERIQDRLSGKNGTSKLIKKGIENLMTVYSPRNNRKGVLRCGASFVVTKLNYRDIPAIWSFCRDNNLYPNLEELIPRGNTLKRLDKLWLRRKELYELKKGLLRLDRTTYGYDWLVHAPLPGHGCLQPYYSVYISSDGYARPCADIEIRLHNIANMKIKSIMKTPFFNYARNIEKYLKGKCGSCIHSTLCIGCRGRAFSVGIKEGFDVYQALCREDPLCHKK
jgi:radical SAM protein with 4Fe4S-binding SPASM domain